MIIGSKTKFNIGNIPVVFTDMVVIAWALYKPFPWSAIPSALFLLSGTLGLPVFASGLSGLEAWTGNTAGYLAGYLMVSTIPVIHSIFRPDSLLRFIGLGLMMYLVLHLSGMLFFIYQTQASVETFFTKVFIPFLPFGLIKAVIAAGMAYGLRKNEYKVTES